MFVIDPDCNSVTSYLKYQSSNNKNNLIMEVLEDLDFSGLKE
jgi:hypothetical protein